MTERFDWDNFLIGETRCLAQKYRQSVATSIRGFIRARKMDWDFTITTDPKSPKPGQRCNMIWVKRIDPRHPKQEQHSGLTNGEMDTAINGFAVARLDGRVFEPPILERTMARMSMRPVFLDMKDVPIQERLDWYERRHNRTRMTRVGWDRCKVGDYEITCTRRTDIILQIKNSLLPRNLLWRFEMRRIQNPEDKADRRPWYLVTRVR